MQLVIPLANVLLWLIVWWTVRRLARNPRGAAAQFLLRTWTPRPAKRFDPITRREVLATAGLTVAAGLVSALVGIGLIGLGGSLPAMSRPGMVLEGIGFIAFLLGALIVVYGLLMLVKLFFLRPPPPRRFTLMSRGMRLGTTDLEGASEEHQLLYGFFQAEREFRSVSHVFEEWTRACTERVGEVKDERMAARYVQDLMDLQLELVAPTGPIALPGLIHIEDLTIPGGYNRLQLQVWTKDYPAWIEAVKAGTAEK